MTGAEKSDALLKRMIEGWVKVVLDQPVGWVPAGTVFWTLPKEKK